MNLKQPFAFLLAAMTFASSTFALTDEQLQIADRVRAHDMAKRAEAIAILRNLEYQTSLVRVKLTGPLDSFLKVSSSVASLISAGTVVLLHRGLIKAGPKSKISLQVMAHVTGMLGLFLGLNEQEALPMMKIDSFIEALEKADAIELDREKRDLISNLRKLKEVEVQKGIGSPAFASYMAAVAPMAVMFEIQFLNFFTWGRVGKAINSKFSQLAQFQLLVVSNIFSVVALNGGKFLEADRTKLDADLFKLESMAREAREALERRVEKVRKSQ